MMEQNSGAYSFAWLKNNALRHSYTARTQHSRYCRHAATVSDGSDPSAHSRLRSMFGYFAERASPTDAGMILLLLLPLLVPVPSCEAKPIPTVPSSIFGGAIRGTSFWWGQIVAPSLASASLSSLLFGFARFPDTLFSHPSPFIAS